MVKDLFIDWNKFNGTAPSSNKARPQLRDPARASILPVRRCHCGKPLRDTSTRLTSREETLNPNTQILPYLPCSPRQQKLPQLDELLQSPDTGKTEVVKFILGS